MIKKQSISTSVIPDFKPGSTLTANMFNKITGIMECVAAKYGVPTLKPLKSYSAGSALTASDMNNFVSNINKIYEHIGRPVPQWFFVRFKIGGKFRSSDLNEMVRSLTTFESIG